ncbi:MAG: RidA family protein [Alphaproteobacteria bacterium]
MNQPLEAKIIDLGFELPQPAPPAANYVPYVVQDNLVYISGQLPMWNGDLKYLGKLGESVSLEDGQAAARLCALNIISQLNQAIDGDFSRIDRCVKLTGFVNSTPDFRDHPKVINGASDVMLQVFGDQGLHARAAVGTSSLPLGVSVEVEAIFGIK